jgi:PAS domain S-box-containing protein
VNDQDMTKEQLIAENAALRQQVAKWQASEEKCRTDDIESQRQAQAELAEREAQLLEAQEIASLGFYILDLATGNIKTSSILDRVFGIPTDHPRTIEEWGKLIHPEDSQIMLDYLNEVISKTTTFDREYRIVRYDDHQLRWVHGRGRLRFNEGGQPVSLLGTVQDITERKQAEAALRKSEERFKLFMDNSPALAWMKDEQGRYVYFNDYSEEHIKLPLEDRIGKTDFELWPPATAEQFRKNDQAVLSSGQVIEVVEEGVRPDGSVRYYHNLKFPFQDSQGKRFVAGVGMDITRQKRIEDELRKAHDELELRVEERTAELSRANDQLRHEIEERQRTEAALRQSYDELRAIYDGMVDGMNILDLGTLKSVRVSSALCRMTGYSEEEALQLTQAQAHPPEALPGIVKGMRAHVEGRTNRATDVPLLRKDGSIFFADIGTSRITYNNRPCLMCFFHDTTRRRAGQEALRRERRSLEHMLRASDHERQLIAYDIHDGLAQELVGAIMQFHVYEQFKDTKPDEAKQAYEGGMMLLRQGHAEARRLISGVRPPILDESGVVAAIAHLVHDPAFERGPMLRFRSKVAFTRLPPVMENVIYRIVQEGLTNARNHSKSKRIVVSLIQRRGRLQIKIRDWGVGFDPSTVQGNGFGLEGMRERVRLLGGNYRIESKLGKGTSVVVQLPVSEQRHDEYDQ